MKRCGRITVRFLLDVGASGPVEGWLKERHHDVLLVSSRNSRMEDSEILDWAVADGRIIVTTDSDFEELVWRERKPHCGLLRLENLPRRQRLQLLEEALSLHAKALESAAIVIALRMKFRVREFLQ